MILKLRKWIFLDIKRRRRWFNNRFFLLFLSSVEKPFHNETPDFHRVGHFEGFVLVSLRRILALGFIPFAVIFVKSR